MAPSLAALTSPRSAHNNLGSIHIMFCNASRGTFWSYCEKAEIRQTCHLGLYYKWFACIFPNPTDEERLELGGQHYAHECNYELP